MVIGAIMEREDPRDVVVLKEKLRIMEDDENTTTCSLDRLPSGSILGTSSVRRGAQLRAKYPYLGNLSVCN